MEIRGYEVGISQRTLQRDIIEIADMFDIEIKNFRGYGYYIAEKVDETNIKYEDLLMNFDLLTSLNHDVREAGYIISEHNRPKGSNGIPTIIKAIKECKVLSFSYTLVRKGGKIISKEVKPYFIKESLGLWYMLAFDESDMLKSYGIDRISELHILDKKFKRDKNINTRELYKHSYGIWDNPEAPVEEVVLSYSPLDGSFIKTTPLHSSQEIIT